MIEHVNVTSMLAVGNSEKLCFIYLAGDSPLLGFTNTSPGSMLG